MTTETENTEEIYEEIPSQKKGNESLKERAQNILKELLIAGGSFAVGFILGYML